MIATKTVYRVQNDNNDIFQTPVGIWCTDNFECQNMSIEDAMNNSICLNENIVDDSIKNCLIFTFYDTANYGTKEDVFIKIEYEELIADCEPVKIVVCKG